MQSYASEALCSWILVFVSAYEFNICTCSLFVYTNGCKLSAYSSPLTHICIRLNLNGVKQLELHSINKGHHLFLR